MPEFAGRTEFWNIGYPFTGALVYLIAPIAIASIAYALRRRWRIVSGDCEMRVLSTVSPAVVTEEGVAATRPSFCFVGVL